MKPTRDLVYKAVFGISVACSAILLASSVDASTQKTFLGPTVAASYTSPMTPYTAYSLLGEAGVKNFRIGATFGWRIDEIERLKISGEYLWQDITYSFISGNTNRWVNQGAVGADYQYDFACLLFTPQLDISGYYSHAPSITLGTIGIPVPGGAVRPDFRRIAGSNAGGGAAGITVSPWRGARLGLDVNYDDVRYNVTNSSETEDAKGFGGTAFYNQTLWGILGFGLEAEVRQPFNNYSANLSLAIQNWEFGVVGEYTAGKVNLPSTYNAMLTINYTQCKTQEVPGYLSLKGDYKNEAPMQTVTDSFLAWTSDPAVYMPQVLAIADDGFSCRSVPKLLSDIADLTVPARSAIDYSVSSHFSGKDLIYSAVGLPPGISINPNTGVISGTNTTVDITTPFTVVVTAKNRCGAVSTSFVLTLRLIIP